METRHLQFDLFDDRYQVIERISAKARSIRIEVRSRREVVLVIPRRESPRVAREFLASRDAWVRQKLAELQMRSGDAALDPQRMNWNNRDRLPLRGIDTLVRLTAASLRGISLRWEHGAIDVFCPSAMLGDRGKLEQALRQGLQHQARQDAQRLLAEESARLGVRHGELRIADQKSLWGSCSAEGNISLSWRLVMAPPEVFRYVVVHELCHIRHHDHSDAFWALVARQMPDYERHRGWLQDQGARLHVYLTR
ncbi:MAG TPA: SprT family zinc-dependent metalloprotease [Stenotrophobium sp.]|nr:SprT family zinc-dependent metalloprotease [Stenotrophobium sp.]